MRRRRELLMRAMGGLVGITFGVLSAVGLALAAGLSAMLGMLAFICSPPRAALDRLRQRP